MEYLALILTLTQSGHHGPCHGVCHGTLMGYLRSTVRPMVYVTDWPTLCTMRRPLIGQSVGWTMDNHGMYNTMAYPWVHPWTILCFKGPWVMPWLTMLYTVGIHGVAHGLVYGLSKDVDHCISSTSCSPFFSFLFCDPICSILVLH